MMDWVIADAIAIRSATVPEPGSDVFIGLLGLVCISLRRR
jgi:hypothetical protein